MILLIVAMELNKRMYTVDVTSTFMLARSSYTL